MFFLESQANARESLNGFDFIARDDGTLPVAFKIQVAAWFVNLNISLLYSSRSLRHLAAFVGPPSSCSDGSATNLLCKSMQRVAAGSNAIELNGSVTDRGSSSLTVKFRQHTSRSAVNQFDLSDTNPPAYWYRIVSP